MPTPWPPRSSPTASPAERAELLARLAGGRLDRARALDGRLGPVRDAFVAAAASVDGTGGAVAAQAELVQDALQAALADLEAAQAAETEQLGAELEAAGYPERTRRAQLRRLEERHKRAHRRARIDALHRGDHRARDRLPRRAGGTADERLNIDRERPGRERPRPRRPRSTRAATPGRRIAEFNPNETLLVERLLLHLPAAGGG